MPRIKFVPDDIDHSDELTESVRQRRGGTLLKIDRLMLHSRPIVAGWGALLGVVNKDISTDARTRELIVCAVGELTGARYEVAAHGPRFLQAGGSDAQLAALGDVRAAFGDTTLFSDFERAILRLTFEMTQNVAVQQSTFEEAYRHLNDEERFIEIITIISSYNMVTRFVVALDLSPDEGL